jgi:two-component system, OmpR family, sensor kinase
VKAVSLQGRLAIWYALALLAILSLFGAQVLWQQARVGLRRVDRELAELSATSANILRDEIHEREPDPPREALISLSPRHRAIAIFDPGGQTLAAAWNGLALPQSPGVAQASVVALGVSPAMATDDGRASTVDTPAGAWRVYLRAESIGDRTYVLLTGSPLADSKREQREALEAMVVGIPIAVLLATVGGLWFSSIGMRPIRLALDSQRQFMADASHELRTPVSVMRSAVDVTLARGHRDEPEYREALGIMDDQIRRVARLVDDMLALARADTGGYPIQRGHLYVDEIVTGCRRAIDLLASERGVTVRTSSSSEIPLDGDEELLRRMLLNVVQNAVQHTPAGHAVTIDVVPNGRTVGIDVTNEGQPIADADRARIFDRFVQLDPARRMAGSGLGLPIARWIAEAHGGTLVLASSGPSGTTFSITLPRSNPLS